VVFRESVVQWRRWSILWVFNVAVRGILGPALGRGEQRGGAGAVGQAKGSGAGHGSARDGRPAGWSCSAPRARRGVEGAGCRAARWGECFSNASLSWKGRARAKAPRRHGHRPGRGAGGRARVLMLRAQQYYRWPPKGDSCLFIFSIFTMLCLPLFWGNVCLVFFNGKP